MSEQERTPGPWRLGSRSGRRNVMGPMGRRPSRIMPGEALPICLMGGTLYEDEANAAFIVRACNAHDALLAACEAVLAKQGEASMFRLPDNCDAVRLVQAAVRLARGEEVPHE